MFIKHWSLNTIISEKKNHSTTLVLKGDGYKSMTMRTCWLFNSNSFMQNIILILLELGFSLNLEAQHTYSQIAADCLIERECL